MATTNKDAQNGCTFRWEIENVSHCFLKTKEFLESPSFILDAKEATKWHLKLYPMGESDENYVSLYLIREVDCLGLDIAVNFQLALLDKENVFVKETMVMATHKFAIKKSWGFSKFVPREKVFISDRQAFLPDDTLTVQCTIWKIEDQISVPKYSFARTVYQVSNRSFVWKIGEFSTLKTDTSYEFKDDVIEFEVDLNKTLHSTKKLEINIISFDGNIQYFSIKAFIINSYGDKENCGAHEFLYDDLNLGVLSMPAFGEMLSKNKARYIPNDELTLFCEYTFSNGAVSNEFCSSGIVSPKIIHEINTEHCISKAKSQSLPDLVDDLKSMYNDRILSDVEIRTETQTFPAHKIILSARSPVFRRMFSNDMKENNSGHIDILDLEKDTLHRMLLYIYTDILEDLQLENGCKLYSAADKYEILSLKGKCSSFLKDNLCPANVCDVLVLADLHNDVDLKTAAQNYILKHDKEVFGSQEWKEFMAANVQLAADVMFKKVFPG